jgi:phospholipase D
MNPSKNPIYKKSKARFQAAILAAFMLGGIGGYIIATYGQLPQKQSQQPSLQADSPHIEVRFSPDGKCTAFTVEAIQAAKRSILVQAYSFTCPIIVGALINAQKRGVAVKILVDRSQLTARGSKVALVLAAGIPTAVDKAIGIAHNKVMIIDDEYVLTGSFNWTTAAEKRNAENLLLIKDQHINKVYRANWEKRAKKASFMKIP